MAATLVGVCTGANDGNSGSTSSITLGLPAGTVAGDVLVLALMSNSGVATYTLNNGQLPASGPDRQATDCTAYCWAFKLSSADTTTGSVTATSANGGRLVGSGEVWRGIDATVPVEDVQVAISGTASTQTPTASVTAVDNSPVILLTGTKVLSGTNTAAAPSGWTVNDYNATSNTTGANTTSTAMSAIVATAGAVTPGAVTTSPSSADIITYTVALRAAAVGLHDTTRPVTVSVSATGTAAGPAMHKGARVKYLATESLAQLKADFADASQPTKMGPLTMTKNFSTTLPTNAASIRVTPAGQGNVEAFCYKTQNTNLAAFIPTMEPQDLLIYHQEPEGDYGTGAGAGAAFLTEFNGQYVLAKSIDPNVNFGSCHGQFQYRPTQNGFGGSFIPDTAHTDFYAIDSYEDGSANSGLGFITPLTNIPEFMTLYGYVSGKGKPLWITEYGRGTTGATDGQLASSDSRRAAVLPVDLAWLRANGFSGISYWESNFSPHGTTTESWAFTDTASYAGWRENTSTKSGNAAVAATVTITTTGTVGLVGGATVAVTSTGTASTGFATSTGGQVSTAVALVANGTVARAGDAVLAITSAASAFGIRTGEVTHTLTIPSRWTWDRMEVGNPWPMFTFGPDGAPGASILLGYYTAVEPTDAEVGTASEIYLAGRTYTITDAQAAALTAAGFGAFIV